MKGPWREQMGLQLSAEELYFIDTYVSPNRRERLKHELSSEKKRRDGLWRFCHAARDILIEKYIHSVYFTGGCFLLGKEDLKKKIGSRDVYIVDSDPSYDRKIMPFRKAADELNFRSPYVLIDRKMQFAYVETEPSCESHEYLYLQK